MTKAKLPPGSRRPTPHQHLVADLNAKIVARDRTIDALSADNRAMTTMAGQRDTRISEQSNTIQFQRESIRILKVTVADLEKALAHSEGRNDELEKQVAAMSPLVEVPQPPVMTTKAVLLASQTAPSARNRHETLDALRGYTDRATARPKHWTEL